MKSNIAGKLHILLYVVQTDAQELPLKIEWSNELLTCGPTFLSDKMPFLLLKHNFRSNRTQASIRHHRNVPTTNHHVLWAHHRVSSKQLSLPQLTSSHHFPATPHIPVHQQPSSSYKADHSPLNSATQVPYHRAILFQNSLSQHNSVPKTAPDLHPVPFHEVFAHGLQGREPRKRELLCHQRWVLGSGQFQEENQCLSGKIHSNLVASNGKDTLLSVGKSLPSGGKSMFCVVKSLLSIGRWLLSRGNHCLLEEALWIMTGNYRTC